MRRDTKEARRLTAELVNASNDEDRSSLASDEAVAHGLSKLRRGIAEDFDALAKQPYFARVVTEEVDGKSVEFRLGTVSFPAQRIVDWRKAPISRLYYNYREGEEFSELIQGREREGSIQLRRAYQGHEDRLNVIELSDGTMSRTDDGWSYQDASEQLSRPRGHDGHLPPILSLITPEQFDLISHNPQKPMVIQGIAGSGKTTVALHRLAWLLHEDNSDAKPERCLVVVFNRSLKAYIETTLPELGIEGVPIHTYHQWLRGIAHGLIGDVPFGAFKRCREAELFKSSHEILEALHAYIATSPDAASGTYLDDLFAFYAFLAKRQVLWPKWETVKAQFEEQVQGRLIDEQDESVLLNLVYAREGHYPCKGGTLLNECDHIVIDEAQDFGIVEIRALLGALGVDRTVTIVGDAAQKIVMNRLFGGWEAVLAEAGFEDTQPIELTVSHRTTRDILDVAAYVRGDVQIEGAAAARRGPKPTILRTDAYEVQPQFIGRWINRRLEEDPLSLSAIICRWPKQAERLTNALHKAGFTYVRWAHRESFDFSPGVLVTNVHQVKGLEFRNVLVVNPTEEQYESASEEERGLLYVAITRAEVRLDFLVCGKPTTLLPELERSR